MAKIKRKGRTLICLWNEYLCRQAGSNPHILIYTITFCCLLQKAHFHPIPFQCAQSTTSFGNQITNSQLEAKWVIPCYSGVFGGCFFKCKSGIAFDEIAHEKLMEWGGDTLHTMVPKLSKVSFCLSSKYEELVVLYILLNISSHKAQLTQAIVGEDWIPRAGFS